MILDTVTPRVIGDSESRVTLEIYAASSGTLTTSNTKVLTANSVKFANTSRVCILDCVGVQYATSIANGWVSIEYVNAGGNNTIAVFGRNNSGELSGYMANPNTAVAGDINLNVSGMGAGDSFTLIVHLAKNDLNGAFSNLANPWNAIASNMY